MKPDPIQPIIDDARARRAVTPASGDVIQRALATHEQGKAPTRRPFTKAILAFSITGIAALAAFILIEIPTNQAYPLLIQPPKKNLLPPKKTLTLSLKKIELSPKNSKLAPYSLQHPKTFPLLALKKIEPPSAPFPRTDDLDYVNEAGSEAAIQRWAPLPQDEQAAQLERIKAIIKGGDDFIDIPLPMVATTATTTAAEALATYQAEREIVDGRLAQGVTLGAKALSFTDLCAELTRKTGVTFTAAPSVADDKLTVFCTKRPVRDVMREITNLFGFTWNRSGQPDEYSYRLTQPVKAQLAEQELRNKSNNLLVFNSIVRFQKDVSGEAVVVEEMRINDRLWAVGELTFKASDPPTKPAEKGTVIEVPVSAVSVTGGALTPGEIKDAGTISWKFRVPSPVPPTNNAERNKALKTLPELTQRVTIAPVPGEREPRLPGESAPEPLVTTADLLEAIHRATGKDMIGDSFMRLVAPVRVTAKNLPLFDALNTVCEPLQLQWGHERGFFQLRTTNFYDSRAQEVPNRLLAQWALSRRMNHSLSATDLSQIATLRDEQLDAGGVGQGAQIVHNLQEWTLATSATLRPHWRFFSSLTPEQQRSALTSQGLAFRALRQAQQWELLRLAFEKKDNVASVATQLDSIRLCVEKTRFVYHYTRPDGTTSAVVFAAAP